jgi:hypothetical protein
VTTSRWSAIRLIATCCAITLATALTPRVLSAHPLHSTITEIIEDRAHGTVRATIRVFVDDFTTAVQHLSHRRLSAAEGAAWDAASLAYAVSAFNLSDRNGRPLALRSCGVKRTADLLWICLEASAPSLASLNVRNGFLCDLFGDQVNVVQATIGTGRRSILFTRGDPAKPL